MNNPSNTTSPAYCNPAAGPAADMAEVVLHHPAPWTLPSTAAASNSMQHTPNYSRMSGRLLSTDSPSHHGNAPSSSAARNTSGTFWEESAALVSREAPPPVSYNTQLNPHQTNSGGRSPARRGMLTKGESRETDPVGDDADYVDSDVSVLSQFHEDAISQAGFGWFQWTLYVIIGLGLAADTIELFVVAYVLPSAEVELCMDNVMKGWLGAITFFGMMIGGFVWGSLADRLGRRRALLSALTVNAVFGAIAAFMPTYGTFMTARLCSGIGIGGSLPVVFAYFSEFMSRRSRGKHLSWLLMAWAIGGVFVALMAWAIIPRTGVSVIENEKEHFSRWREFLLVCSIPSFLALFGLLFMPESPRYLLESGREVEAMLVYQRIYKSNHSNHPDARYTLSELELPAASQTKQSRSGSKSLPAPAGGHAGIMADLAYSFETFWSSFLQLFIGPTKRITTVLLVVWFTQSFGFYGLSIWFPEYLKLLKMEEYNANAQVKVGEHYTGITFNGTIDNIRFVNSTFQNVTFQSMVLNHVTFSGCVLRNSEFRDVVSSRTYFENSTLVKNHFADTDLYPYRFRDDTVMVNNTFVAMIGGCTLDFDFNFHLHEVFLENLIGQLALIPGTVLSVFLLDKVGRVKMICISMFLSAAAAFFIWFLYTKVAVIVFESAFNLIFIVGWNALDVTTTEIYPCHLRATGYGFLSAVCRIAGILGSLTFGSYIGISRAVPMLTTAVVLFLGAVASIRIPETKDVLL